MTRLVLKIAGWLVVFYLLIFIPSFVIEAARFAFGPGFVYIYNDAPASIYTIGPQHAAYGVNKLDHYPDQMFIVDGSTAAQAFIPVKIMGDIPGYKVHNLAINGTNITELGEIADMIDSQVDVRSLHSAVFILCGQYSTFLENRREFRDSLTSIDQERLRHRLYRAEGDKVVPVFRGPAMTAALFLVRPFIWLYTMKFNITNELQGLRETLASFFQPPAERQFSGKLEFYRNYWQMLFDGQGVSDSQFDEFTGLVAKLAARKATVVYVDLPVPTYLRKDFPIYDDYRRHVKRISGNPSVHYLDLSAWAPDNEFSDDIHPKPEFSEKWSGRLSQYLKTVVAPPLSALKRQ